MVFVRDGQEFPRGFFGGGLVDAVEDNPDAREHAESFRGLTIAGFVLSLTAIVPMGAGAAVIGVSAAERRDGPSTGAFAGGLALVGTGLAMSITGLALSLSAQPHFFDAINIYNDDVDADLRQGPRAQTPVVSAPVPAAPTAPPPLAPTVPPPAPAPTVPAH